jgi:hypothetical protein
LTYQAIVGYRVSNLQQHLLHHRIRFVAVSLAIIVNCNATGLAVKQKSC